MSIKKRWFASPLLLLAVACSSNSADNSSLTIVVAASTTACPNGGVTIETGIDTDGDGQLSSSEITSSQNVCNAVGATATLVSTKVLAAGNSHCIDGGTEIDTGLDNGAGGGTAGDGILQSGEITSSQYVCSGSPEGNTLVSTQPLATGNVHCPGGGTEIDTGLDNGAGGGIAGDGILQSGEITSSQYVCGSSGTTLVSTVPLTVGDPNCANGGTEIDTGTDNGANGGTAGDGILEAGEITSTQYICNGASSTIGSLTEPSGPAGTFTIDTSGGDGNGSNGMGTGNGGSAGEVQFEIQIGTHGGHVKLFSTGVVDASFTMPTVGFVAGAVPVVIPSSMPINDYDNQQDGLDSNDQFFEVTDDSNLYTNVDGNAIAATSLDIAAGATVTFALNSGNQVNLQFSRDVRNAGTITTALQEDNVSGGGLQMYMGNYIGLQGSSIALNGHVAAGVGGSGGSLNIQYNGVFANQGIVHTFGAAGTSGNASGNGGNIEIQSTNGGGGLFNTGDMTSAGGSGGNSPSGAGGSIEFNTNGAPIFNAGALFAHGGDGGNSNGSSYGGGITLQVGGVGSIRNSGALDSSGGDGNGGSGSEISIASGAGDFFNSGSMNSSGGDSFNGTGGSAGELYIDFCCGTDINDGDASVSVGSFHISGNLTAKGGSGPLGGGGGAELYVFIDPIDVVAGQEIEMLGYTNLNGQGGKGGTIGGNGGSGAEILFEQDADAENPEGPAGAVINYANININGGDGPASGGSGGNATFTTQHQQTFNDSYEIVANHGDISARGGAASATNGSGGGGGQITFRGINGVQNSGDLDTSGGACSGSNGTGGNAGDGVQFVADTQAVTNSGAISNNGGSSTGPGGNGGGASSIKLVGVGVTNSGNLSVNGGDGDINGGEGGNVTLFSSGNPTVNTGVLSENGGSGGEDDGNPGTCTLDGAQVGP